MHSYNSYSINYIMYTFDTCLKQSYNLQINHAF